MGPMLAPMPVLSVCLVNHHRELDAVDPRDGDLRLYAALEDPLQRRDLAGDFPDTARALATRLHADQALVDFLLESNRVAPSPADPRGRS